MSGEVRRGFWRVFSNYSRLGSTLLLGIIEVPILIAWLGKDAFGLISLLGPTIGIGAIVQDIVSRSMVRELGQAHHLRDERAFQRIYNGCWVYSIGAFLVSIALFTAVIAFLLPRLTISDELMTPALIMAICTAAFNSFSVLVTPTFNMYAVQERFGWQNLWLLCRRLSQVIAAVVLFFIVGIKDDPPLGVILYAVVAQGLNILQMALSIVILWVRNRELIPRLRRTDRDALREIRSTFGWNSGVVATTTLADNLPLLFVNLYFGLGANAIYGIARRLGAYARMLSVGVTFGIDAVSARVSSDNRDGAMEGLLKHSTRLNAWVALPAGVAIFVLVEPLIKLWLARSTDDPSFADDGAIIARILVISTTVRGISEGWQRLLYGAGHVRQFAPLVILSNLGTPLLLWIAMETVPASIRFETPALAYAVLAIMVNLVLLPVLGARILNTSISAYLRPLLGPMLATAIASPVLVLGGWYFHGRWRAVYLLLVGVVFGLVYLGATWAFVLDRQERGRAVRTIRRVVLRGGGRTPNPPGA